MLLVTRLTPRPKTLVVTLALGGLLGQVESSFPMFHSCTADKEDCDARFFWESDHSELVRLSKRPVQGLAILELAAATRSDLTQASILSLLLTGLSLSF